MASSHSRRTLPFAPAVAVTALAGAGLGLALGGFGAITVVSGGSMSPALRPGDAVLTRFFPARQVTAGQVVTFHDQERDALVTHRVVTVQDAGARRRFVTRGDANTGVESWTIDRDDALGLAVGRVPYAGYPLAWPARTAVTAVLYLILAIVAGRAIIGRIWPAASRPS